MVGASGTLYENEKFQLQFKFSQKYPFDSPEVNIYFSSLLEMMRQFSSCSVHGFMLIHASFYFCSCFR